MLICAIIYSNPCQKLCWSFQSLKIKRRSLITLSAQFISISNEFYVKLNSNQCLVYKIVSLM